MSLILGIEYCKIDSNGRFKFPIALKKQLEGEDNRFVVRPSLDAECLEMWTYASFETEIEFLKRELNRYNTEDRKMLRKLTAGNIVEMDQADRVMIPNELRGRLKGTKDIVLQSTGDYIEIWDYDIYSRMKESEADYAPKVNDRLGHAKRETTDSE